MSSRNILQRRDVSILLITVLLLAPIGIFPRPAGADALGKVRDILEDSRPSVDSYHEFYFVTATGVDENTDDITITFPSGFNLSGVGDGDMDLAFDDDNGCDGSWTEKTLSNVPGAGVWGASISGQIITFDAPTDASSGEIPSNRCVQIQVGSNASGGSNEINNHATPAHYDIDIAGSFGDTGATKIVVVATITAQATIDQTLNFVVAGVLGGDCTLGSQDTTATSVDFSTINSETFYDLCQNLTISTNAADGYAVTVNESDQLENPATDTIADGTCDATCDDTTWGTWTSANNNGFGYCLENESGTDANAAAGEQCDDATPEFKTLPSLGDSEAAHLVMSNAGLVSGSSVDVGYRITVDGTQPAGVYTNNIIFIATPTY